MKFKRIWNLIKRTSIVASAILALIGGYFLSDILSWADDIFLIHSSPSQMRASASQSEKGGESLVLLGVDFDGKHIAAEGFGQSELNGPQLACKNCHGAQFQGRSEGSYNASAIAWQDLMRAAKKQNVPLKVLLQQAVNMGRGIDGRALSSVMPKFSLPEHDIGNLLHWFKAKDHWKEYGDSGNEVTVALSVADKDIGVKSAAGLSSFFADKKIHGRRLVFTAVEGDDAASDKKYFAGMGDGFLSDAGTRSFPTLIFEMKESSSQRIENMFCLLRSPTEWWQRRVKSADETMGDGTILSCRGNDVVSNLSKTERVRCAQILANENTKSQIEVVARWIDWLPAELGMPTEPAGVPVPTWISHFLMAKIIHGAIASSASMPRQEFFREVLDSGQKIEIGNGIVASFAYRDRIGLDGEFVLRWDVAAKKFETIWRPF
jgi:hypothetical protein